MLLPIATFEHEQHRECQRQGDLELLVNKCCQKASLRSKKIAEYTINYQGFILRIGSRKRPNY